MATRPAARLILTLVLGLAAIPAEAVDNVQVLGLFKDKALVQIDGRQRLLKAGQTSPEGVTLVSANAREAVLEVDGKRGSYTLGSRISSSYAAAQREQVTVQIWPDRSGMYTVNGIINGYPVTFLVDTGANTIAMNAPQARRLGIDYRVAGQPGWSSTASGTVQSYRVNLARVKVGEIELRDVKATVIDGDHPTEVLLGMTFLGRLEMNREGRVLELRQRQP